MRTLRTFNGFRVEDRPEGLYLLGDFEDARNLVTFQEGLWNNQSFNENGHVLVEIGYSADPEDGVAEWGTGDTEAEAWRFALGAHFGSHDDPEAI